MTFLEFKEIFEKQFTSNFELLELYYTPYSFGSGLVSYRIKGLIIKIVYDGKDNEVQILVSVKHDKYSDASWTEIFIGSPMDSIEKGISKLKASFQISEKTYSVKKIREVHKQAYAPWTKKLTKNLNYFIVKEKNKRTCSNI